MLKLCHLTGDQPRYWETWDAGDGTHVVHWGVLGERGESKTVAEAGGQPPEEQIQRDVDQRLEEGYAPADEEDYAVVLIEYPVDGFGTEEYLEKRHRLEDRMNETLGWTGLGACDGGSIGSGTMEVCCLVVDFELARRVIEDDLKDTEFNDYSRIYDEDEEN